jgi:hypothetical protein
MSTPLSFTARRQLVALAQLGLGLVLLAGIWFLLPARYALVDVVGSALAACAIASCAGLVSGRRWALSLARGVAWTELVIGTLTVTALALSASQLLGSYGPVGSGGVLLLGTVALLLLPYLVVFPAWQLIWLRDEP